MKQTSLIVSAAIIVIANVFALAHGVSNRMGTPDAEITLTNRELQYFNRSTADDDSGITLHLAWTNPDGFPWPVRVENRAIWLDQQRLERLGFDCSVNPASADAQRYYQRQRPRQVFVALEYDGAAWRAWVAANDRAVAEQRTKPQFSDSIDVGAYFSHLVAVDADLDPVKLRALYPDRTAVVILPAVVAVTLRSDPSPRITGLIQQLPSSIYVPRPFSDEFRRHQGGAFNKDLSYRVRLRYGASLEPWVTGVEFHE